MMLANFVKSLIVFTLCGWMHDQASYALLHRNAPAGSSVHWTQAVGTIPFFVAQPFALAVEAFIRKQWRNWKARRYGVPAAGEKGAVPDWLVFAERLVGFVCTWWWLGWTARWFVVGLTRAGLYRRGHGQVEMPSLAGGLVWGRWKH
jgi:hypothetical protein